MPSRIHCLPTAAIAGLFLVLISTAPAATAQNSLEGMPRITVNGDATQTVVPNLIVIRFAIEARQETPTNASNDIREKAAKIIAFLKDQGIDEKFIRSENLTLEPIFRNKSRSDDPFASEIQQQRATVQANRDSQSPLEAAKPIGYEASRSLSVELKNPDIFETVYAGILERGVNVISDVTRTHSDLNDYLRQARLDAMKDAKQKAVEMTEVLGTTVGRVLEIEEVNYPRNLSLVISTTSDVFGDSPNGFAMGNIQIEQSVRVMFEIQPNLE